MDLPPLPPYPALPMRSEDRVLWNEWAREYARAAVEKELKRYRLALDLACDGYAAKVAYYLKDADAELGAVEIMLNGLTKAETDETASVQGLSIRKEQ